MASKPSKKRKVMALTSQWRLVGQFVSTWNLLENALNSAIISMCKLDILHGAVITANLHFQTKMHIVVTMTDLLSRNKGQSNQWIENAAEVFAAIHRINSEWRTLVVHHVIHAKDMQTVYFYRTSAKRKLGLPRIERTKRQFDDVVDELLLLCNKIDKIARDTDDVSTNSLAKALASAPTGPFAPLGLSGLPHLPPPLPQNLSLATLGTEYGMLGGLLGRAEKKGE